ncbi:hypothetical protein L1049_011656 [Liquidambar formosana]|uniref:Phosphofructokinase n=1 Tax=Liquidambar formosana TaxID=63359 RepID=A0AAP0RXI7_LIQFO
MENMLAFKIHASTRKLKFQSSPCIHSHVDIVEMQDLLEKSNLTDASGNVMVGDIGVYIQQQIKRHFKEIGVPADVKYIDPTYMIRACRTNASDAILCTVLGQNAVHGAFAGYSGITVGICNSRYVYLPIPEVISSPRVVDPNSRMWH